MRLRKFDLGRHTLTVGEVPFFERRTQIHIRPLVSGLLPLVRLDTSAYRIGCHIKFSMYDYDLAYMIAVFYASRPRRA